MLSAHLFRHLSEYREELETLKAHIRSKNEVITVEEILRLKEEMLEMNDVAQHMQVVNEAADKHFKREELYIETDEDALHGKIKGNVPRRRWPGNRSENTSLTSLGAICKADKNL